MNVAKCYVCLTISSELRPHGLFKLVITFVCVKDDKWTLKVSRRSRFTFPLSGRLKDKAKYRAATNDYLSTNLLIILSIN